MCKQQKHRCIEGCGIFNEDALDTVAGPNSYAEYFACPKCGGITNRFGEIEKKLEVMG